jgi:hypothetical protein
MGWFGISFDEKEGDVWGEEVKTYVSQLAKKSDEERDAIVVYAVDFHI